MKTLIMFVINNCNSLINKDETFYEVSQTISLINLSLVSQSSVGLSSSAFTEFTAFSVN